MNETVREWLAKAEGDFRTAGRELRAEDGPNFDAVCFHAQQCIEKLFKARIIQFGAVPPRSHDLVTLQEVLAGLHPDWSWHVEELRFLTRAAVEFRYPGESADRVEAEEAFRICEGVRASLLKAFE